MDNYEIEKISIDYSRSTSNFFMVIVGGQVTLLGSLFKGYNGMEYALCAIGLMLLASLAALSISESVIRRISKKPDFKNRVMVCYVNVFPHSIESEWVKSLIAGLLATSSLLLYAYFIWAELWP